MPDDKIEIESITTPGRTERVDRANYTAMRAALLAVLPDEVAGMTVAEGQGGIAFTPSRRPVPTG